MIVIGSHDRTFWDRLFSARSDDTSSTTRHVRSWSCDEPHRRRTAGRASDGPDHAGPPPSPPEPSPPMPPDPMRPAPVEPGGPAPDPAPSDRRRCPSRAHPPEPSRSGRRARSRRRRHGARRHGSASDARHPSLGMTIHAIEIGEHLRAGEEHAQRSEQPDRRPAPAEPVGDCGADAADTATVPRSRQVLLPAAEVSGPATGRCRRDMGREVRRRKRGVHAVHRAVPRRREHPGAWRLDDGENPTIETSSSKPDHGDAGQTASVVEVGCWAPMRSMERSP